MSKKLSKEEKEEAKRNKMYPFESYESDDDWKGFYENVTHKELADILEDMSHRLMNLHSKGSEHISRRDNNELFEAAYSLKYTAERIKEKYQYDPALVESVSKKAISFINLHKPEKVTLKYLSKELKIDMILSKKVLSHLVFEGVVLENGKLKK